MSFKLWFFNFSRVLSSFMAASTINICKIRKNC